MIFHGWVAEGNYQEAADGYRQAGDTENLVRILVANLRQIDEAVAIVRKTKSRDGAKIIAKFFQTLKDYKSVIEFCLLAGLEDDAFAYARANNYMEHYAQLIEQDAPRETRTPYGSLVLIVVLNIAMFFEQAEKPYFAGRYLMKAGEFPRALQLLLQCRDDVRALDLAIELVRSFRDGSNCRLGRPNQRR